MNVLREQREWLDQHPGQDYDESRTETTKFVAYSMEEYLDVEPELQQLYPLHWKEIALDQDIIKLDVDYEKYQQMACAGMLMLICARDRKRLVGYHLSVIHGHLHYRTSLTCFSDIFYLLPQYRVGMIGYKMLKFMREAAKDRGVQKIYMGTKITHDIGPLLSRLGFMPIERIYTWVNR